MRRLLALLETLGEGRQRQAQTGEGPGAEHTAGFFAWALELWGLRC